MKIAYLMYTQEMNNQTVRVIRSVANFGHHVYLMINDEGQRSDAYVEFSTYPTVHVERDISYATEGDLSLTRFYLYKMREALEKTDVQYFVTLGNSMTPLKSDKEITQFFASNYPANFYQLFDNFDEKYYKRYYPFTNFISFGTKKFTRGWAHSVAFLLNLFGVRRKPLDNVVAGSQYFAISDQGARQLVEHIDFLMDHFKLSWYSEQIALSTMFERFMTQEHRSNSLYYLGPDGKPEQWTVAQMVTSPLPENHDYLYGGTFVLDEIKGHIANYKTLD